MKERFTDEQGHNWQFVRWRIAPPGHPLPCPMENMTHIPPEAIFINEEGLEVGLHPNSPYLGEFFYTPAPFQETVVYERKLNSKQRRQEDRSRRFGR